MKVLLVTLEHFYTRHKTPPHLLRKVVMNNILENVWLPVHSYGVSYYNLVTRVKCVIIPFIPKER